MNLKKMSQMLLVFTLSIFLLNVAQAADAEQSYAIKGAGSVNCERYITALKKQSDEYLVFSGWVDGYITALNQFQEKTFDVAPWQSTILLTRALGKYCKKNPKTPFFNAMTLMVQALYSKRLQKRSELVKITAGGKTLLIYRDIVKHIQDKLNKYNGGNMKVDGLFGKSTETELRKFQQAKKIPVTGIPDQVTLQILFRE